MEQARYWGALISIHLCILLAALLRYTSTSTMVMWKEVGQGKARRQRCLDGSFVLPLESNPPPPSPPFEVRDGGGDGVRVPALTPRGVSSASRTSGHTVLKLTGAHGGDVHSRTRSDGSGGWFGGTRCTATLYRSCPSGYTHPNRTALPGTAVVVTWTPAAIYIYIYVSMASCLGGNHM